jgi:hypothetical protein
MAVDWWLPGARGTGTGELLSNGHKCQLWKMRRFVEVEVMIGHAL